MLRLHTESIAPIFVRYVTAHPGQDVASGCFDGQFRPDRMLLATSFRITSGCFVLRSLLLTLPLLQSQAPYHRQRDAAYTYTHTDTWQLRERSYGNPLRFVVRSVEGSVRAVTFAV